MNTKCIKNILIFAVLVLFHSFQVRASAFSVEQTHDYLAATSQPDLQSEEELICKMICVCNKDYFKGIETTVLDKDYALFNKHLEFHIKNKIGDFDSQKISDKRREGLKQRHSEYMRLHKALVNLKKTGDSQYIQPVEEPASIAPVQKRAAWFKNFPEEGVSLGLLAAYSLLYPKTGWDSMTGIGIGILARYIKWKGMSKTLWLGPLMVDKFVKEPNRITIPDRGIILFAPAMIVFGAVEVVHNGFSLLSLTKAFLGSCMDFFPTMLVGLK